MTVMNVESIAIELIIPTPDNPRTVKPTDPAVIEMAATMRPPGGQLQPGVARPHPTRKGFYDLRAGARRLAAAKLAGKPVTSMAERRAGIENRRKALAIEKLRDEVHKCEVPKVWTVHDALRAMIVFGTSERNDSAHSSQWTKLEKMLKASEATLKLDALDCLRSVFARRLVIYTAGDAENRWPEAESIALELAIDLRKLKADADQEIPEPKSWAKQ